MTTKTALTLNQAYAEQLIGTWPTSYYTGATEIEYLIVAGGGGSSGGNGEPAGGGGAGGVLTGTYMVSNYTSFTDIEVGAGGAGAAYVTTPASGSLSRLSIGGAIATSVTLTNAAPTSIYTSAYSFTSVTPDFDFKIEILGTRASMAGFLGIGINNVTASTITYAVEYAQYSAYGTALARKLINYAYTGLDRTTPFRLRATKTGGSIVFSITNTSDSAIFSETVSLTAGNVYRIYLYYNKDSTNDTQIADILTDTVGMYAVYDLSLTAVGGGRGGLLNGGVGQPGGSGGGGSGWGVNVGGVGTAGQGYAGGTGTNGPSGGGGGGSAAGQPGSSGQGGAGGTGYQWVDGNYYAGGGGGSIYGGGTYGAGGIGGGGRGGNVTAPYANAGSGVANSGGGGGSAAYYGTAGSGGSGVVIIRYPDSYPISETNGSTIVTTAGGYRYYAFTTSGSIRFNNPERSVTPTVEYLVVAGGGGGGNAGGGGAGGLLTAVGYAVATGSAITVTVGSGGLANTTGGNSVFGSILAYGGGYGGPMPSSGSALGGSGGSGGGAGTWDSAGGTPSGAGSGTVGQGYNGGTYGYAAYGDRNGAGGGGAGGVGSSAAVNNVGGAGGPGIATSISGTSTYYAGGGGGTALWPTGTYTGVSGSVGAGGIGGGGAGGSYQPSVAAVAGTANTGGGGGGSYGGGAAGGSGVVIIRYPSTYSLPLTTTGYPTVAVGGGYRTYTFTSSGSITF